MKAYELCTPGPVQMSPAVRDALTLPMIPHYGTQWVQTVYDEVLADLHKVFQTTNDLFVIPGSGSGAIESAFCSLASPDRKVAVFRNGFFGDRLLTIAGHYFPNVVDCRVGYSEAIGAPAAEAFLDEHPDVDIVAIVHGETSTGVANDVEAVARVVKQKERVFLVDAVSTLGGMNVPVDDWNADFCLCASQKGLSAPPGLGIVSVSELGWSFMPPKDKIPGWYHNLRVWKDSIEEWGAWHPYPITLPVQLFYALKAALREALDEGLSERFERHKRSADYFRTRVQELGAGLFCTSAGFELDTVTAFVLPEGFHAPDLLAFMKDRRGIIIAGGHAAYKDRMCRVGHMGYGARTDVMDRVLDGIAEFLSA